MPKRKYDRIFMLLNGINDGLGANINGSCDIEIIDGRGKLKVYIGGIGRLKDKQRTFYLICRGSDNSTAVPVGSVERNGLNAVIEKNFDPDNMFGSGKKRRQRKRRGRLGGRGRAVKGHTRGVRVPKDRLEKRP